MWTYYHVNLVFAVLFSGFILTSCGGENGSIGKEQGTHSSGKAVNVEVEEVMPILFTETISLTGVVKALDDITLTTEEGGVIKEWRFEKGKKVKRGDVIAVLKDDVLKPTYDASLAQYNTAELNYQKQIHVYKEQAISELQFKTSEYARDAAKAQAELALARWERTRLKSPINGVLDERFVDEGEFAAPGVPVARIVNIRNVKILINVPERYAGTISLGTMASFSFTAFKEKKLEGKISYIGSTVSPDNRTIPVELVVPNLDRSLKPEMIVKASILQSAGREAILVDEDVVQQVDANKFVLYVENNETAELRIVELGGRMDNRVEILTGLKPGDRVITSGHQNVFDGQKLTTLN